MPLPLAAGLAIAAGTTAINQGLTSYNADVQNKMARENMVLANNMSRQNLVDSASMHQDSLKRAGLSPLHEGEFTPATAPAAAAAPNIKAPQFEFMATMSEMEQIKNLQAQNENINANTEKTKAETQNIQQTTGIVSEQDKQAKDAYGRATERLLEIYPYNEGLQHLNDELHSDLPMGLGAIRAEIEALNAERALSNNFKYDVSDAYDRFTYEDKIKNGSNKYESEMPRLGYKLMVEQITNTIKTAVLLDEQANNTSADTKKIAYEMKKLEAERDDINMHVDYLRKQGYLSEVQADNIRNKDFQTLLKEGDYKGAAVAGASGLKDILIGIIKMLK